MTSDVVIKIGTSSVTTPDGVIDHDVLSSIAHDVVTLRERDVRCVLVTSGAITAGWTVVGDRAPRPRDAVTLQAVSAVGQPLLMDAWRRAFGAWGVHVGQILLAPLDFAHRRQYLHARATIHALWERAIVPIVNENDAVADEEIRFGDNDRLAALVANLVAATRLLLLTDTPGLLTADPRLDPHASLISEVTAIDRDLEAVAGSSSTVVGSGGMASKLAAARIATWSGVETAISDARRREPVLAIFERRADVGTHFVARTDRLSARRCWIAFALPTRGCLTINDGAVHALVADDRSLLRVGVIAVSGGFESGDAVEIIDATGVLVAKGLVRLDADHIDDGEAVIVHRDDLVLLRDR